MPKLQPHILVILVDEHRFDCVGINGNPEIHTPNLDALARDPDGVSYTNCFSTFPLCTPARYSLLTGCYVHQHLGIANRSSISRHIPTYPRLLKKAGYSTTYVGKLHADPTYAEVGCDQMILAEQEGPGRFEDDYHRELQAKGLIDFTDLQDQWPSLRKNASSEYFVNFGTEPSDLGQNYSTDWIGNHALHELDTWSKEDTQPHLLITGFIKPHHPFDAPVQWGKQYSPENLSMLSGWTESVPPGDYKVYKGFFDNNTLSIPTMQRILQQYYASITQIDAYVGEMVSKLKSKHIYDDTLIVYVSDHGDYMGYHHMILKNNYLYDPVIKVPLIVKYPKHNEALKSTDHQKNPCDPKLVSLLDATATILDAANITIPPNMNNAHALPRVQRDFVFAESINGLMLRNSSYKLIQSDNIPSQFFDLRKDPSELNNQIDNPVYQSIIHEFRQLIDDLMERDSNSTLDSEKIEPLESWACKHGFAYEEPENRRKTESWFLEEYSKRLISKHSR